MAADPPLPGGTVAERKAELRARMRELRAAIPPDERETLSRRIEERLMGLPEVAGARRVLLFAAFGSEVPTAGIARRLRTSLPGRRRLLLPFLRGEEMRATEYLSEDELIPSAYGPMEPLRPVAVDPAEVDAVIAPGLAFDRAGHRVGYGGGHFDRFLAQMRRDAALVGICFHVQLVEEVPHGPGDEPVHVVVTDRETIFCR